MSTHKTNFFLCTFVVMIVSGMLPAHAQYVWVDEKGTKQFSDVPPPPSTPKNRILKTPSKTTEERTAPAANPVDTPDSNNASAKLQKPVTTATKNEDFQKRRTEQVNADKKAADEAQNKADKAKNCERAKSYQQALDSGVRIATADKNGERSYMDDAQRAKETEDTKRALAGCQ